MKKILVLGLVLVLSACSSQQPLQQGINCNDKESCMKGIAQDIFMHFEAGKQFDNEMVSVDITFRQGGAGIDAAIAKSTGNKEFNKLALENVKQIIAYEENPLVNLPDEDKDEFSFSVKLTTPGYKEVKNVKRKQHIKVFPNGQVREMGWLANGEKVGEWVHFYDNGELQYIINYPSGEFESHYRSGQIEEKGTYLDRLKDGKWAQYYENGKLKNAGQYLKGDKVGEWVSYDESGNKKTVKY